MEMVVVSMSGDPITVAPTQLNKYSASVMTLVAFFGHNIMGSSDLTMRILTICFA